MTLYDPHFKRLRIRYFINEDGDQEELRLPFCSPINDVSIQHSTSISKCQYQTGKYKSSILKRINRRSPVTIKGMVTSDSEVKHLLEGVILEENFKTLNQYLYALKHLEPTVIYAFGGSVGTMNIETVQVDSYGKTRNFEITGYRVC